LTSGADDEIEGYELFVAAGKILKEGCFNLRKFATNSKEADETQKDLFEITSDELTFSIEVPRGSVKQKCLGIILDKLDDNFVFRFEAFSEAATNIPLTKRGLLRLLARLYDSPGFVSPILLLMKSDFQSICETKMSWDDPLPESTQRAIRRWLRNLKEVIFILGTKPTIMQRLRNLCMID